MKAKKHYTCPSIKTVSICNASLICTSPMDESIEFKWLGSTEDEDVEID